ncbi:hypothetical protein F5Y10DRAFT_78055 [Nemania abortiva]|nr:hypothetical protein F5Y10DRAFT_78055 [Nemania abortiva]
MSLFFFFLSLFPTSLSSLSPVCLGCLGFGYISLVFLSPSMLHIRHRLVIPINRSAVAAHRRYSLFTAAYTCAVAPVNRFGLSNWSTYPCEAYMLHGKAVCAQYLGNPYRSPPTLHSRPYTYVCACSGSCQLALHWGWVRIGVSRHVGTVLMTHKPFASN